MDHGAWAGGMPGVAIEAGPLASRTPLLPTGHFVSVIPGPERSEGARNP
jgi:hypothetical protein